MLNFDHFIPILNVITALYFSFIFLFFLSKMNGFFYSVKICWWSAGLCCGRRGPARRWPSPASPSAARPKASACAPSAARRPRWAGRPPRRRRTLRRRFRVARFRPRRPPFCSRGSAAVGWEPKRESRGLWGRSHAVVPAAGGGGVLKQPEPEHGGAQHPQQTGIQRPILWNRDSREASRTSSRQAQCL